MNIKELKRDSDIPNPDPEEAERLENMAYGVLALEPRLAVEQAVELGVPNNVNAFIRVRLWALLHPERALEDVAPQKTDAEEKAEAFVSVEKDVDLSDKLASVRRAIAVLVYKVYGDEMFYTCLSNLREERLYKILEAILEARLGGGEPEISVYELAQRVLELAPSPTEQALDSWTDKFLVLSHAALGTMSRDSIYERYNMRREVFSVAVNKVTDRLPEKLRGLFRDLITGEYKSRLPLVQKIQTNNQLSAFILRITKQKEPNGISYTDFADMVMKFFSKIIESDKTDWAKPIEEVKPLIQLVVLKILKCGKDDWNRILSKFNLNEEEATYKIYKLFIYLKSLEETPRCSTLINNTYLKDKVVKQDVRWDDRELFPVEGKGDDKREEGADKVYSKDDIIKKYLGDVDTAGVDAKTLAEAVMKTLGEVKITWQGNLISEDTIFSYLKNLCAAFLNPNPEMDSVFAFLKQPTIMFLKKLNREGKELSRVRVLLDPFYQYLGLDFKENSA